MMLIKLLIYFALCFIFKLLSFGLGATTGSNLSQLLVMQKRFLTTIANVPLLHPTAQLFKKFRIIRAQDTYEYELLREYRLNY